MRPWPRCATQWVFAPVLALLLTAPSHAESQLTDGEKASAHLDFRITIPAVLHPQALDPQEPLRWGVQRRVEHLPDAREQVTLAWP
ncbi:hypothetical protein [Stenotrophomonas bentonitica]|uniref:hypothetical protein n=1 Tax=Stenotrophomonas bentonitica TaxID=1450134 RepID=UPI0031BAF036